MRGTASRPSGQPVEELAILDLNEVLRKLFAEGEMKSKIP